MTEGTRFISRLTLRRESGALAAMASLLREGMDEPGRAHRLLWTLLAEDAHAKRDFLFRRMDGARAGDFIVVSSRAPRDPDR
jgi:hypothetical protein